MKKNNNILGYEILDCKKIKKSALRKMVRKKIKNEKDEVTVMKMSKMKKLAIAGAVIATTLLSFTTVNAATDGAITKKVSDVLTNIKVTINGEKTEIPATVVKTDDGCMIQFELDDDVNEIEFNEEDLPELAEQGSYISGCIVESNEDGSTIEERWENEGSYKMSSKKEDDGTETIKIYGPDGSCYTDNHVVGEPWSGGSAVYDKDGNLISELYAGSDKAEVEDIKEFSRQSEQARKHGNE